MLNLPGLDQTTRMLMREEINDDAAAGRLYISPRLTGMGRDKYESVLLEAVDGGTDATFAADLTSVGMLLEEESSHRNGVPYTKKVPVNAPQTLAEGEFNRFYMRAVCLRAISDGQGTVTVFRAKNVAAPRTQSINMVGTNLDAATLLKDLRNNIGIDTALGLPPGPNSGLSVALP